MNIRVWNQAPPVVRWGMSVVGLCAFGVGLARCASVKPAVDVEALELSCVDTAVSRQGSIDCRNAVRAAWGLANGVTIVALEGGSADAADEH